MSLRAELEARIQSWAQTHFPQIGSGPWVRPCTDPRHGHFQTHLPMVAAKQVGENPRDIASRLAKECAPPPNWETPEVAGSGFVNYKSSARCCGPSSRKFKKKSIPWGLYNYKARNYRH